MQENQRSAAIRETRTPTSYIPNPPVKDEFLDAYYRRIAATELEPGREYENEELLERIEAIKHTAKLEAKALAESYQAAEEFKKKQNERTFNAAIILFFAFCGLVAIARLLGYN